MASSDGLKAPTSEYLLSLATELGDLYLAQDQDIDTFRDQREMRTPAMSEADKDYVLVHVDPRDPDITEEAFQQHAMLSLERPRLKIVGGEGDTAQTIASKLEHFTEESLWQCGTRTPGQDTMSQVTDAALNDGGGWSKMLWARDLWDARYALPRPGPSASAEVYHEYDRRTEDEKKKAGPPFVWAYVDPRSVYPQWSGGQLVEVLECADMPMRFAFRRYRLARDYDGNIVPEELGQQTNTIEASRLANSTVQMFEHWDEEWASWAICGRNYHQDRTGHIVKQYRHRYPFGVPYDYAPGLSMSHWRNRKVGWSIGRTKLWLVKYRQYLRAMHAQYVARDLLSPLVTYGETPAAGVIGENGLPKEPETSVHPGEILNLPPGRQLQRIQYPDAATLEKHMALIDGAIRDLESPRVTTLSGMEGAGFAISQVLQYTRTRVGPVRHGLESLLKGQTEKMWSLIREHAGEKVWVFYGGSGGAAVSEQARAEYIGFGPKDLERPMHISWEVQAQLPTDEMIMARYAHERLSAGTWGKDEAVTYLGDNPDEIRRSIARDEIRQSEPYKKWLYNEVFMFAGRGDMLQKAQQAMARAQLGQVQQGLAPAGPAGQQPQPGVFEGGGPGLGGVPDLGALATAPNGAGAAPPAYNQVIQGAQQAGGGM
ncbi:MAG TPA: hypothetical protein VFG86_08055 [Chloroflexota bacterium]|nr:hypothetical protein [Chloroflexota bacterium]